MLTLVELSKSKCQLVHEVEAEWWNSGLPNQRSLDQIPLDRFATGHNPAPPPHPHYLIVKSTKRSKNTIAKECILRMRFLAEG